MTELGSGSGSSYPATLDTDTSKEVNTNDAGRTKARAEVPNDLAAAIIAVESTLGTNPHGTKADVKTYLQLEHNTDGTHKNSIVVTLTGTQTLTNKTLTSPIVNTPTVDNPTLLGSGWPSFSVHRNGSTQNISAGVATKIAWTTEEFDTNNNFDSTTNYRFTPTVAGKYLLSAAFTVTTTPAAVRGVIIYLYKNGASFKRTTENLQTSQGSAGPEITVVVDANGTTDYFEVYAQSAQNETIDGTVTNTWFTGSRIG